MNMQKHLTQTIIAAIKPNPQKAIWITDAATQNLRLYVGTGGKKVWYVRYLLNGKHYSEKLGIADALTVAQARDMANDFAARLLRGEIPQSRQNDGRVTLGDFLDNIYRPWVTVHRRAGKLTYDALRANFSFLYDTPIEELKPMTLDKWRTERVQSGWKAATANRRITALKAAISWGVKRGTIENNPITKLEPLQESDSYSSVRYLIDDERKRLFDALDARESRLRKKRENHNEWLSERGHQAMPLLDGEFADHIKPMVLFSLNTGIRQGSLFSLLWSDIDFNSKTMTIRGIVSKSGKTLRLPLNATAVHTLTTWREQLGDAQANSPVFPSPISGGILNNVKKAWQGVLKEAEIENFRWHDMRHDFASQLVMKGVDLNTVRELLGHADLKMTLRYAHLAPESKMRAVELLDK